MSLLSELADLVGDAFDEAGLDRRLGEVVISQRPDLAQFQCNGALAAAKQAGLAPRTLAADLAATIGRQPWVLAADVASPGFLNITQEYSTNQRGTSHLGIVESWFWPRL